jgi:hypothetical protein
MRNRLSTRALRRAGMFFATAALASCASSMTPAEREMGSARDRWRSHGFVSYDFTVRQLCFCPVEITQPTLVQVRNGAVVSATSVETGAAVDLRTGKTIDEIFDDIDRTFDRGRVVKVTYDATYGYPTEAQLDRIEQAIDDEGHYFITSFQPR